MTGQRIDAPAPPTGGMYRQFMFTAVNAASYLRTIRYAPTCKLRRLEAEGLLTATPTNESADVLVARRENIQRGLADARQTLAEWPNRHAIPVANLRGRCIEYEAALQDVEAALYLCPGGSRHIWDDEEDAIRRETVDQLLTIRTADSCSRQQTENLPT